MKERLVILHVVDDVNLVEQDTRVQDIKRGVIKCTRKDNIFEEL